jgi:nitrate reductase NapAB chaperone NapD
MPTSSLIVRTEDGQSSATVVAIKELAGAAVTDRQGSDLVVVTETASRLDDRVIWNQLEKLPGVLNVDLIYHNFEDQEGIRNE